MVIHLVKKDMLISKKYVVLVLALGILIPLFVLWRIQAFSETLGFVFSVIFSEFMFCQNLSMKENQYSKASALLCSTPYPRSGLVISKYILFIIVFGYCVMAYAIDILIFPQMGNFNLCYILMVFAFVSIVYAIYMPIQYQLGYEKTKFFFMVVILAASFGLPTLIAYGNIDVLFGSIYSSFWLGGVSLAVGIVTLVISMFVSISIYKMKELV